MICRKMRQQFSLYLEGDLGARKRAALEAHLQTCASCCWELERFRGLVSLLEEPDPVTPPGVSVEDFRATLREQQAARGHQRQRIWRWSLAAAVTVSLAMGLGGWLRLRPAPSGGSPSEITLVRLEKRPAESSVPANGPGTGEPDPQTVTEEPVNSSPTALAKKTQEDSEGMVKSPSRSPSLRKPNAPSKPRRNPKRTRPRAAQGAERLHKRTPVAAPPKIEEPTVPPGAAPALLPAEGKEGRKGHPVPPPPGSLLAELPGNSAYYAEVHYPNGGYAILTGGSPQILTELTAPQPSSYRVEITNTATGESNCLRWDYDTMVNGQRENVTLEFEKKVAEKNVSEEEKKDESSV